MCTYKSFLFTLKDKTILYSGTCLKRPPFWPSKIGLSRQVVSHSRFTLYEFSTVVTENNGLPKEVGLSWQWSLKTGFTVHGQFITCVFLYVLYKLILVLSAKRTHGITFFYKTASFFFFVKNVYFLEIKTENIRNSSFSQNLLLWIPETLCKKFISILTLYFKKIHASEFCILKK